MNIGVVVFPGSNCDHDAYYALKHEIGVETTFLFHKEHDLRNVDAVVLPGGFSYGDYLR
jgi:phosphoribosylformylglycinamidine synthase